MVCETDGFKKYKVREKKKLGRERIQIWEGLMKKSKGLHRNEHRVDAQSSLEKI